MSGCIVRTGSIQGFSEIDLAGGNTRELLTPTHFSLAEAQCRIEAIRQNFDPQFLDNIIIQVLSHIQNFNNPHQVTLSETGSNVMQLVYEAWLDAGNTGTMSDFTDAFFQTAAIASQSDIASGTSTNLVTVAATTTFIANHNTDPNAHQALLNTILPGTPPTAAPTFAIDAHLGAASLDVTATRSTSLTILNNIGNLSTYAPNTVAVDYSGGNAGFSLFGARTNTITPSNPTIAPNGNFLGSTMSLSPSGTLRYAPDGNPCAILSESYNNETHGYHTTISMTAGVEYTASCFIYPLATTGGIEIYLDNQTSIALMINLTTNTITTAGGSIIGHIEPMINGFLRVGLQFVAPQTTTSNFCVVKTQSLTIGAATAYQGTGAAMFGLFGLQFVAGAGLSPYIATTTNAQSHDTTVLTINTTLANITSGIIGLRYKQATSLLAPTRVLFNIPAVLTLSTQAGILTAATSDSDSSTESITLSMIYDSYVGAAFSYAPNALILGSSGVAKTSPIAKTLALTTTNVSITIGSTSFPFDGKLQDFVIYPVADTAQAIEFVLGMVS